MSKSEAKLSKNSTTGMIPSTIYRGIKVEIRSAELKKKFDGNSSPKGKEFLVLNISLENKSTKAGLLAGRQVIIFPQEEIFLVVDKKTIPLENYKLEGNLDPEQKSEGHLLFTIPKGTKKCALKLGEETERSKIDISF